MKNSPLNLCCLAVVLALSGCVTTGGLDRGPGSALAKRYSNASDLTRLSIRKAVAAEIRALETAGPGTVTSWQGNKGASGEVVPGQAFEVSGRACRLFDHKIIINGVKRDFSATACQIEKGDWEPLS